MDERSFQPDWMSAPGATIADILKRRKLSAERFAELTGYSQLENSSFVRTLLGSKVWEGAMQPIFG